MKRDVQATSDEPKTMKLSCSLVISSKDKVSAPVAAVWRLPSVRSRDSRCASVLAGTSVATGNASIPDCKTCRVWQQIAKDVHTCSRWCFGFTRPARFQQPPPPCRSAVRCSCPCSASAVRACVRACVRAQLFAHAGHMREHACSLRKRLIARMRQRRQS